MSFDAVLARLHRASRAGCGCSCTHGVGALERANPLPPGRYWVDVFETDSPNFSTWLAANKGAVSIVSTEHFDANAGGPARDWVLFQVSTPVAWQGPGFPTIADASVTSSSDTAQRPDPTPDVSTTLEQGIQKLGGSSSGWIFAAAAGGLLVLLLTRGSR
jgi:hypothetical protein